MKSLTLARIEKMLRPMMAKLSPELSISIYSKGRKNFIQRFEDELPLFSYEPPKELERTCWGIRFRTPLMNSAGMFKNAKGYELVSMQGAGAYVGGTSTYQKREGNRKGKVFLPFFPYHNSCSSSNWLGLPNKGDEHSSNQLPTQRSFGTPIGWSIAPSPELDGITQLESLVKGLNLYEKTGIDFIEINQSCPNTGKKTDDFPSLEKRLEYLKEEFLVRRNRVLPVIIKFSNDTKTQDLPQILDLLFDKGFDGINLGNTSTDYGRMRYKIDKKDIKAFDYFTKTFGGGVSGRPLKERSLELCSLAVEYLKKGAPNQEFHVIRTGGIESWEDIKESNRVGIYLNQWFTGYFEIFSRYEHLVYEHFFKDT